MRHFIAAVTLIDATLVAVAIWLACEIRGQWGVWGEGAGETNLPHLCLVYGPWIGVGWLAMLAARGAYSPRHFAAGGEEFNRVFVASLLTAGTVAMVCYLAKYDLSRGFVSLTFLLGIPMLLIGRFTTRKVLHHLRGSGHMHHRVLVVGDAASTAEIAEILRRERYVGYSVVGACTVDGADSDFPAGIPILGRAANVRRIAHTVSADAVLVTGGDLTTSTEVRRTAWALEGTDVALIVAPNLTDVAGPRVHVRPVAGLPLLHIEPPQAGKAVRWGKRAFDMAVAGSLLVVLLPVFAAVALAIKFDDGGPAIFRQPRVGLRGKAFICLKFRSMVPGAESLREELLDANEACGVLFKIRKDPRMTRVGRFIRRYSLDELPQLLNVIRGQMSLVGPRPPLAEEVASYATSVDRRLLVRPGMTGLWQVSGRSSLSWRDSVRLDLYYVDNWSMFQDVVILAKTLRAVVRADGAS